MLGSADIVPGVSGSTLAHITGTYEQLLQTIKAFAVGFFRLLLSFSIGKALRRIPWNFLLPLVCGIAVSIFSLARLTLYLLRAWPEALGAFFLGLILSPISMLPQKKTIRLTNVVLMTLGAVLDALQCGRHGIAHTLPQIFLADFIAFCAMILPGISGSFMRVLMGQRSSFPPQLTWIFSFLRYSLQEGPADFMVFSRVLSACFLLYPATSNATLIGVMASYLRKVWPWKEERIHPPCPMRLTKPQPLPF